MAAAAFIVALIATAASTASSIQQGKAASNNAKSAANMAEYNAKVAENNATAARQQAGANEDAHRREVALQLGRERANIAETGSGLDAYGQSLANSEIDALNIRYGGELKALGAGQEATLQRSSAAISRNNAKTTMQGAYLQAGASALSTFSSYSSAARLPRTYN